MPEFLEFFSAPNLSSTGQMSPYRPWDFAAPDLDKVRSWKKTKRREWMSQPTTVWNAYSTVRPTVPSERVSESNPPRGLRGFVADYDSKQSVDTVVGFLQQIKVAAFRPNFVEISLSGNVRLVWVFERELLVDGTAQCNRLVEAFFEKIGVPTLLAGFDAASSRATQIWTNGGEWYEVSATPMPWAMVLGTAMDATKSGASDVSEIPLDQVKAEVEKRWPGRWAGEFAIDVVGVRFWDLAADNPNGCRVKPDGMQCFSGPVPFMRWEQIFGAQWAAEKKSLNLGQSAEGIWFEERQQRYWLLCGGEWCLRSRENIRLELRMRGLSEKVRKGSPVSDADTVLNWIHTQQKVDGVAVIINRPAGLVYYDGKKILNISRIKALEPAAGTALPEEHFPWTWGFINGLFGDELARDSFLAWLKRFYDSQLNHRRLMGQAVFLCGPKENGKTLLCMKIVKPLMGDKAANPYDHFVGKTAFNSELLEAPLLAINDEESPERESQKQKFLSSIKSFVVNPQHAYHPKFCDKVNIPWTGRIMVTLNEDEASIGIMPEVNSNTRDKLMFFASRSRKEEWEDRDVIEARIEKELPFFARWLLDWTVPEAIREPGRMGVRSYFDKDIEARSSQQRQEHNLKQLLELWVEHGAEWANPQTTEWIGVSGKLKMHLDACMDLGSLPREWNTYWLGRSLRDLSRIEGSGVTVVKEDHKRMFFKITRKELIGQ